jgi:nucleoside-diphosphate kinase
VQRTLVLLKPDAVARRLVGRILARFESRGLAIRGLKLMNVDRDLAERHYAEHAGKPFYSGLVEFIGSGPVVALCLEGKGAVDVVRGMVGATNAAESAPGSIRGDLGMSNRFNLIHASDSPETAAREIANFFGEGELLSGAADELRWIYDWSEGEPI